MVITLCYDAVSRNVQGLGISPFVMFSLSATAILPACLLIIALQDRIGRKAMASASLLLSGIFISVTGGIIFAAAASDKSEFSLGQSMFFVGSVVGSMVLGYLADVVGRLPILIVANLIAMTGNLLTIWSTNVTLFCIFRMISGIATDSNFVMMYILGELETDCGNT